MKILFLADPISHLKPLSDSTLCLVREALKECQVYWGNATDVEYQNGRVTVNSSKVVECQKDVLPRLEASGCSEIRGMDAVLIRKDPPFDNQYVRLCWLLSLVEKNVWMMNRPSLLIRYHEKLIPLEAHANGFLRDEDLIPTHIGSFESAQSFVKENKFDHVVIKPFLGFAGGGIALESKESFLQMNSLDDAADAIVQPYFSEVTKSGDRRVFFLEGNLLAHFVRMPRKGGFVSNLAQGGSAQKVPLSAMETEVLEKLGKFLKSVGIVFAGADVIDGRISEVNITSPTGLRSLEALEGNDYSKVVIDFVKRSVGLRIQ